MIKEIVNKLIDELPVNVIEKLKKKKNINLILEGGVFNGSYLIGALYFLKELESRKYIKTRKFSGCSIGAICALFYLMDDIQMTELLYFEIVKHFKKQHNLQKINELLEKVKEKMEPNIYKKLNDKLYICYYSIETCKKEVKCTFKDNEEVIEYLRRSCFIPIIINGNLIHGNKYLDGMFPHIFSLEERNENRKDGSNGNWQLIFQNDFNTRTIYFDLFSMDKLKYLLSVKNEGSNNHRIIAGIVDIHLFFMKESSTQMCSYVEDWNLTQKLKQKWLKLFIEKIIIYIVYVICMVKKNLFENDFYEDNILFKIVKKIVVETYKILIDNYCV